MIRSVRKSANVVKTACCILAAAILFVFAAHYTYASAAGSENIGNKIVLIINTNQIIINGDVAEIDTQAVINSDSRTMIPARAVCQALGASVDWDGATKQVLIGFTEAEKNAFLNGEVIHYSNGTKVVLKIGSNQILVNGVVEEIDTQAVINSDSRTMIPARAVCQALGASVDWDGATKQVFINYSPAEKAQYLKEQAEQQATKEEQDAAWKVVNEKIQKATHVSDGMESYYGENPFGIGENGCDAYVYVDPSGMPAPFFFVEGGVNGFTSTQLELLKKSMDMLYDMDPNFIQTYLKYTDCITGDIAGTNRVEKNDFVATYVNFSFAKTTLLNRSAIDKTIEVYKPGIEYPLNSLSLDGEVFSLALNASIIVTENFGLRWLNDSEIQADNSYRGFYKEQTTKDLFEKYYNEGKLSEGYWRVIERQRNVAIDYYKKYYGI